MNRLTIAIALLSLALVSCSRVHRREEPAPSEVHQPATTACEERCKADTGIDADPTDCMTQCAVTTDLETHHLDEGLNDFVADESYNEKDGEGMREVHNEASPEEVPECAPEPGYDAENKPDFETIDTNGDGVIDSDEVISYCEKACVPDEMAMDIFTEADINADKVISKEEFDDCGEDTKTEEAMDEALEEVSQGDDESNVVQNTKMEEWDEDNSGGLNHDEANKMVQHEVERRTEGQPLPEETVQEMQPKIDEAIDEVDTDGDGEIEADEYVAPAEDGGEDMGEEIQESVAAKEDEPEIDDLARAGEPAASAPPTAPAGLISHRRQLRRGVQAQQARRNQLRAKHMRRNQHRVGHAMKAKQTQRKIKFAEALLAEAKNQQHLRKVAFAQHQRRLRNAMLMRKQARTHRGHRALRHRK